METRESPASLVSLAVFIGLVATLAMLLTWWWTAEQPRPPAEASAPLAATPGAAGRDAGSPQAPVATPVEPPDLAEDAAPLQAAINPPPELLARSRTAGAPEDREAAIAPEEPEDPAGGVVGAPPGKATRPRKSPLTVTTVLEIDSIWRRHVAKSRAVKRYRDALHKDPQLRPLIEKYWRDLDLLAFGKAALRSSNFRRLTIEAFTSADTANMVLDMVRVTPADELERANKEMKKNNVARKLAEDVSTSSGLPVGSLLGGKSLGEEELLKAATKDPSKSEALKAKTPKR